MIYLTKNSKVIATFGLKDIPKKDMKKVINSLKEKKINILLLTGDNEETAMKIAKELEIENVIAGLSPEEKEKYIKNLVNQGKRVIMVGDGVNDAPSLAQATIGIALKTTSDIPTSAADVILESSSLFKILDLFSISRVMLYHVKQNITLSLLVSLLGVIITLGIIPGVRMNVFGLLLIMIMSSVMVMLNSFRIRNK